MLKHDEDEASIRDEPERQVTPRQRRMPEDEDPGVGEHLLDGIQLPTKPSDIVQVLIDRTLKAEESGSRSCSSSFRRFVSSQSNPRIRTSDCSYNPWLFEDRVERRA